MSNLGLLLYQRDHPIPSYVCPRPLTLPQHPFFDNDSPVRARDMDLATTNAYALPGNLSAGIGHGSWSNPLGPAEQLPEPGLLNSSQKHVREELKYSARDIAAVEEWVKRHVESTWHSLGTCSMAPREGNSIVRHGVLDERLNVHGVKGLKVADLSICPDNVGCECLFLSFIIIHHYVWLTPCVCSPGNTYSTALLIGEKCAVLTAEDLGYSGAALDMKVPEYNAPGEIKLPLRL